MRAPVVLLSCLSVSACFDDATPPGAQVVCLNDDDCDDGRVCDLLRHSCVAPGAEQDGTAPQITEARFEPASVSAGPATLIVVVDEELADIPDVVFAGAGTRPVLGAVATEGLTTSFTVDVSGVPEDVYPLAAIAAVDTAGNLLSRPSGDVVLRVDRTAPLTAELIIEDATPADGSFLVTDVAPNNLVVAHFFASELLAQAPFLTVGAATGSCAVVDGLNLRYRCEATIGAGTAADGDNVLTLTLVDDAGNDNALTRSVPIDIDPPALVQAVLDATDPDGVGTSVAFPGGTLAVTLVFNEPVLPPTLVVASVPALPLGSPVGTGAVWSFSATVPAGIIAGTYGLQASFADAAGHVVTDAPVPLQPQFAAGVPFSDIFFGVCAQPGSGCADLDGDGRLGITPACGGADDCNDDDATVFFGAPEIPGDGLINDCETVDGAISPSVGVFVDPLFGDDATGTGSDSFPVRSLEVGQVLVTSEVKRFLFLRSTDTPVSTASPNLVITASLIGGLIRDGTGTWLADASAPRTRVIGPGLILNGAALVRVRIEQVGLEPQVRASMIFDSEFVGTADVSSEAVIVKSVLPQIDFVGAADRRVVDSISGALNVGVGTLRLHRARTGPINLQSGATLWATSSTIVNTTAGLHAVDCIACGGVYLFHVTALNTVTATVPAAVFAQNTSDVVIGGSILSLSQNGAAIGIDNVLSLAVRDSDLLSADGYALREADGTHLTVEALNACNFSGCDPLTGGNVSLSPLFEGGDPDQLSSTSPLIDFGVDLAGMGAPSSVAADIDGTCRYRNAAADVGPDERF